MTELQGWIIIGFGFLQTLLIAIRMINELRRDWWKQ